MKSTRLGSNRLSLLFPLGHRRKKSNATSIPASPQLSPISHGQNPFDTLPVELIQRIAHFLSKDEVETLSTVCMRLYNLFNVPDNLLRLTLPRDKNGIGFDRQFREISRRKRGMVSVGIQQFWTLQVDLDVMKKDDKYSVVEYTPEGGELEPLEEEALGAESDEMDIFLSWISELRISMVVVEDRDASTHGSSTRSLPLLSSHKLVSIASIHRMISKTLGLRWVRIGTVVHIRIEDGQNVLLVTHRAPHMQFARSQEQAVDLLEPALTSKKRKIVINALPSACSLKTGEFIMKKSRNYCPVAQDEENVPDYEHYHSWKIKAKQRSGAYGGDTRRSSIYDFLQPRQPTYLRVPITLSCTESHFKSLHSLSLHGLRIEFSPTFTPGEKDTPLHQFRPHLGMLDIRECDVSKDQLSAPLIEMIHDAEGPAALSYARFTKLRDLDKGGPRDSVSEYWCRTVGKELTGRFKLGKDSKRRR